jgi:hypothetical protein
MVARVMAARLRLLVGLHALVTHLGHTEPPPGGCGDHGARSTHEVVTPGLPTVVVSGLARGLRPVRSGPPLTGRSIGMALALAAGLVAVGARPGRSRRIADTGAGWRSLLLGAPPVLPSF